MKKQFVLYCVFLLAACGGGSTETLIAPTPTIGFISKSLAENFDVQGHRGARGLKPENTLPAFETALDMGVSTLELDLHFTVDQVVIIWHDDKISTNKCSTNTNLLLSQLTLKQLKTYHCSRNPDTNRFPFQNNSATTLAGKNYQIQTLDELFTFVQKYANSSKKSKA